MAGQALRSRATALRQAWLLSTLRTCDSVRCVATGAASQQPAIETPSPGFDCSQRKTNRRESIKHAKPFSEFLTDNFNRQHDYLRISLTERCNLRCLYCMPEEGVPLSPPDHLLSSPEIFYISSLFVSEGVNKIRLTGGEPTVRRDILPLMHSIGSLRSKGLRELAITTNGISLHRKLDSMVEAGLTGINLSLDTLDPFQFQIMTRRKGFDAVMRSMDRVLEMNEMGAGVKLKINCVVMRGLNDRDILPFVELGREKDIEVRFIEYMPFDGNKWNQQKMMSYAEMLDVIRSKYPDIAPVKGHKNDTSKSWQIPGFVGKVGFITSMTHNFCGTCNRLRITSDGNLKVCLFGNTEVSLRDILRKDNGGKPMDEQAFEAIKQLEMNRQQGLVGQESAPVWSDRERELLHVIGAAVKRKKEKHAGMGELENMKNRPMILIEESQAAMPDMPISRPYAVPTLPPIYAHPLRTSRPNPVTLFPGSITSSLRPPWNSIPVPQSIGSVALGSSKLSKGGRPRTQVIRSVEHMGKAAKRWRAVVRKNPAMFGNDAPERKEIPEIWHAKRHIQERLKFLMQMPNRIELARMRARHTYPKTVDQITFDEERNAMCFKPDFLDAVVYSDDEFPQLASLKKGRGRSKKQGESHEKKPASPKVGEAEESTVVSETKGSVDEMSPEQKVKLNNGLDMNFVRHLGDSSRASRGIINKRDQDDIGRRGFHTVSSARQQHLNQDGSAASGQKTTAEADQADKNNEQPENGKLTHVNNAGEAHMVNISDKADTRRVAFATSTVRFSIPNVVHLIRRNRMNKGDVLSTARIAGIMAAKQTPNLVPLCHNIVLTGAEVELKLLLPPFKSQEQRNAEALSETSEVDPEGSAAAAGSENYFSGAYGPSAESKYNQPRMNTGNRQASDIPLDYGEFPNGAVFITARCESTTATGVEMEALVAANAAALTVYDMSKAVDKHMVLGNSRVVLKAGGKSGTWVEAGWLLRRTGLHLKEPYPETFSRSMGQEIAVRENLVPKRKHWKIAFRTMVQAGFDVDRALSFLGWMRTPITKYMQNADPRVRKHVQKLLLKEGVSMQELDWNETKLMAEAEEDEKGELAAAPAQQTGLIKSATEEQQSVTVEQQPQQPTEDDGVTVGPIPESVEEMQDLSSLVAHLRRSYMRTARPAITAAKPEDDAAVAAFDAQELRPYEKTLRITKYTTREQEDENGQVQPFNGFETPAAEKRTHVQFSMRRSRGSTDNFEVLENIEMATAAEKANGKTKARDDDDDDDLEQQQQQQPQQRQDFSEDDEPLARPPPTKKSKKDEKAQKRRSNGGDDPRFKAAAAVSKPKNSTRAEKSWHNETPAMETDSSSIDEAKTKDDVPLQQERNEDYEDEKDNDQDKDKDNEDDEPLAKPPGKKSKKGKKGKSGGLSDKEKATRLGVSVEKVQEVEKALGLKGEDWVP